MKKYFSILLACMLMVCSSAVAQDLGVQIIGSSDAPMETLVLDDMQLGKAYTIEGYAEVAPQSFEFINVFPQYLAGKAGDNSWDNTWDDGRIRYKDDFTDKHFVSMYWQFSSEDADFAWLLMDITNLQKKSVSFMQDITVKIVYNDEYEYAGWVRQFDYNYDTNRHQNTAEDQDYGTFMRVALDPADEQPIDMMYTGHYVFGCTLPNAVISSKAPLRMEITLGDNELTYHMRK